MYVLSVNKSHGWKYHTIGNIKKKGHTGRPLAKKHFRLGMMLIPSPQVYPHARNRQYPSYPDPVSELSGYMQGLKGAWSQCFKILTMRVGSIAAGCRGRNWIISTQWSRRDDQGGHSGSTPDQCGDWCIGGRNGRWMNAMASVWLHLWA